MSDVDVFAAEVAGRIVADLGSDVVRVIATRIARQQLGPLAAGRPLGSTPGAGQMVGGSAAWGYLDIEGVVAGMSGMRPGEQVYASPIVDPDLADVETVAKAIEYQLEAQLRAHEALQDAQSSELRTLPRWIVPAVRPGTTPRTVTMGELGQQTARTMADLVQNGTPAIVTRHGQSIAVIIPVEPGSPERAAFAALESFSARQPTERSTTMNFLTPDEVEQYLAAQGPDSTADGNSTEP